MIQLPFLPNVSAAFFSTPSVGSSTPAIDDKNVYCAAGMSEDGCARGVIIAFEKSSLRQVWRTELSSGVGDSAIEIFEDRLYVCNNNGPICLDCNTGEILWECHLVPKGTAHSFQEIFLSVANDGVFVGSPFGHCYRINRFDGNIIYKFETGIDEFICGAPLLFNNYSYWATMSGNFYCISRYEFALQFHVKLEYDKKSLGGCFAGPRIAFNEVACVTQSGAIVLIDFDGKIKHFALGYNKFIGASNYVNTRMLTADVSGKITWHNETLMEIKQVQVQGKYLFGAPQVIGNKVIVTTYGTQFSNDHGQSTPKYSNIFVLERGEIVEAYKIPICLHALPTVKIDKNGEIYVQLTGFEGDTSTNFCAIARIAMPSVIAEAEIVANEIRIAQELEAKQKAEAEAEAARKKAEEEAEEARKKAEEEAEEARKKAEKKKADEEAELKKVKKIEGKIEDKVNSVKIKKAYSALQNTEQKEVDSAEAKDSGKKRLPTKTRVIKPSDGNLTTRKGPKSKLPDGNIGLGNIDKDKVIKIEAKTEEPPISKPKPKPKKKS